MIATGNPGKRAEWQVLLVDAGYTPVPYDGDSPEEDASTYVGNATIKAVAAARLTGRPALGDDVGLAVDALDGAPGLFTKRWAEEHGGFFPAREVLAARAKGSRAVYGCALAWADPERQHVLVAQGFVVGRIGSSRGAGAGFEPCFWPGQLGRPLSALPPEVRARVHHRARAWASLCAKLSAR